eukprot:1919553-Amphidinium_carterae.3
MQKRVLNITTHISSLDTHQIQAAPSSRQGNPVESTKDHRDEPARSVMTRWGVPNPDRGRDSTGGSAPVKGRPEESRTEVCIEDHRVEPARTVMTRGTLLIRSVMTRSSQRKDTATRSLSQWRNAQNITVKWHQQSRAILGIDEAFK